MQVSDWSALYSDPHAYYCNFGDDAAAQIDAPSSDCYTASSFDLLEGPIHLGGTHDDSGNSICAFARVVHAHMLSDSTDEFSTFDMIKSIGCDELPPLMGEMGPLF